MTATELKNQLTVENIIQYVTGALGSDGYKEDNMGNPIFQTIDHNERGQGKYKLYYYDDKKLFVSYTAGESMDIFELTERAGYASDFRSAFDFVASYFGYDGFFQSPFDAQPELTEDWGLITKYDLLQEKDTLKELVPLCNSLVEYFPNLMPYAWYREGMSVEAMQKFGVRMDTIREKIIIPHYDIEGRLVGIRGRSFNWIDLENGIKYAPIYFGEKGYNHPLGENLYGLNLNKEFIHKTGRAILFESEKSVILMETYYPEANCGVAVCGSSISETQVNLLLSIGVSEVIIAFDREGEENPYGPESSLYKEKLTKLGRLFAPYVNTYYIFDAWGKTELKDSPIDKGRDTFEYLLNNKIFVPASNTMANIRGRR